MRRTTISLLASLVMSAAYSANLQVSVPQTELEARAQMLKQEMIELGTEMQLIEAEFLYPGESRVEVFLSMDVGQLFSIDGITVQIDGKTVADQSYFSVESDSFKKGSVQRLFMGNVDTGNHEVKIIFAGRGPHNRNYKRGVTYSFNKKNTPILLEVRIQDDEKSLQPNFVIKEWNA